MAITLNSIWWYGNKANEEAIERGRLDYETFAKAFPHILNNDIIATASEHDMYFEPYSGDYDDEQEREVFQWYIVPEWAVNEILTEADEVVYYCAELDIYLWGVTHYGTAWSSVFTNVKIEVDK